MGTSYLFNKTSSVVLLLPKNPALNNNRYSHERRDFCTEAEQSQEASDCGIWNAECGMKVIKTGRIYSAILKSAFKAP
jgi:hypothetical protein